MGEYLNLQNLLSLSLSLFGGQLTIPSPGRTWTVVAAGGSGQVEIPETA